MATTNLTNTTREIFSDDLKVLRFLLYLMMIGMVLFGSIFYFFEIQERDGVAVSRLFLFVTVTLTLLFSYHPRFPLRYTRRLLLGICYLLIFRIILLAYNNNFEVAFFVALLVVIQIVSMILRTSTDLKYFLGLTCLFTIITLIGVENRPPEGKIAMIVLMFIFTFIQFYLNNIILLNNQYQYEQRQKIEVKNKALQETTEQMQALNDLLIKKNKELDRFSYIASHDLKAPLRAINNLSEWIEEDMAELMPPDVREQMTLLRSRVRRMERLINGLLEYSRVGRLQLETNSVHTGGLVAQIIGNMDYPETFTFEITNDMPTITTKTTWLRKIFTHLILNAIQYHPRKNGHVIIGYKDSPDFHHFFVKDDGDGIKPEYHDKIFIIFQTLEARDKNDTNGVGLAIVKKYVEDEGGQVWIDSKEGEGSTFWFTLPKRQPLSIVA